MKQHVGLSDKQAQKLLTQFGYNEIVGKPRQTPFHHFAYDRKVFDENRLYHLILRPTFSSSLSLGVYNRRASL